MGEDTQSPGTVQAFIAELFAFEATADPVKRAKLAPRLIERCKGVMAAAKNDAIAEAVAGYGGIRGAEAEVARQAGVSRSRVSEAVKAHKARAASAAAEPR